MANFPFFDQDIQRLTTLREIGFSPTSVFDVGAASGTWSALISTVFPKADFHLFEPLADIVPKYKESCAEVLRDHPRFQLHKVAVGEKTGRINFSMLEDPASSTALDITGDNIHHLNLPIISLDDGIRKLKLPIPQLLKIDIQGGELKALKGFKEHLSRVEVLLLETWLGRGYGPETPLLHELWSWLRTFGFELSDFTGCYRTEKGTLLSQDCIFINRAASFFYLP